MHRKWTSNLFRVDFFKKVIKSGFSWIQKSSKNRWFLGSLNFKSLIYCRGAKIFRTFQKSQKCSQYARLHMPVSIFRVPNLYNFFWYFFQIFDFFFWKIFSTVTFSILTLLPCGFQRRTGKHIYLASSRSLKSFEYQITDSHINSWKYLWKNI